MRLVAIFLPDSKPEFLRSFVVDFPASKGFILKEAPDTSSKHSISIEQTLAGRVFRTGEAWAGTHTDLLQLGFKNQPGIAEGLEASSVCRWFAVTKSLQSWPSLDARKNFSPKTSSIFSIKLRVRSRSQFSTPWSAKTASEPRSLYGKAKGTWQKRRG
jgi:hypothetical protein